MTNSKITMQSVRIGKVLAENILHPFNCYPLTTKLNPDAFDSIEGEEAYEEFSFTNDFNVDCDFGCAINIKTYHNYIDLYENDNSITVVIPSISQGYRYPKEYFKLIESPQFALQIKQLELSTKLSDLEEKKYPKEIYKSIKKAMVEAHK